MFYEFHILVSICILVIIIIIIIIIIIFIFIIIIIIIIIKNHNWLIDFEAVLLMIKEFMSTDIISVIALCY